MDIENTMSTKRKYDDDDQTSNLITTVINS
jgi:hypothetical protein